MNGECDGQPHTFYAQGLILDITLGPKPLLNITGQVCSQTPLALLDPDSSTFPNKLNLL